MNFQEINSLKEAFDDLTDTTLLVVDLDNTLIECSTAFGSYQWASYLIQKEMSDQGKSLSEVLDEFVPYWEETQHQVEMQLIEKETSKWIASLKEEGQAIIALTGRSNYLVERTLYELKRNRLAFSPPSFKSLYPFEALPQVGYQEGVLFVGPKNDKGTLLTHFLNNSDQSFEKVVFVDDQERYLEQCKTAVEKLSLDFVGMHFVALNEKVRAFDYAKALEEQKLILN